MMNNYSSSNLVDNFRPVNISDGDATTPASNGTSIIQEHWDFITGHLYPFPFYKWIFIITFCIVFIVGISGNFLVIYSVWRCKELKSVTNLFLVNLAVADFMVILTCLPVNLVYENWHSWFFGDALCKIFVYVQRVSLYVSVLTLTVISIERYLAICHPLGHHTTSLKTKLSILAIWLISLATPCYDFVNQGIKHLDELHVSLRPWLTQCVPKNEITERNFQIFDMTMFYFIPLCVMGFSYIKIATCLWSSTMTNNSATHNLHHDSGVEQLRMRKRTAKMLIVVVITFGLCYLPIQIVNIIRYTEALNGLTRTTHYLLYQTTRFCLYFNSAINPVIYNFMSAKFRKQFKSACFGCYTCFCKPPIDSGDTRSTQSFISRTNNVRMTTIVTRHYSGSNS